VKMVVQYRQPRARPACGMRPILSKAHGPPRFRQAPVGRGSRWAPAPERSSDYKGRQNRSPNRATPTTGQRMSLRKRHPYIDDIKRRSFYGERMLLFELSKAGEIFGRASSNGRNLGDAYDFSRRYSARDVVLNRLLPIATTSA